MESAWQKEWALNLRSGQDLVRAGLITPESLPQTDSILKKFKFSLPRYYAGLIDRADPLCPIRLQAIPDAREMNDQTEMVADPLGDLNHQPAPRITHRYGNRALLHLTPNCSLYCRYCFRKSLLNDLQPELFGGGLSDAITYLASHPETEEVILSGGDPLLVTDGTLGRTISDLGELGNLKRLRIHTRIPVTFPARVTDELAQVLSASRLPVVTVVHFNHPKEITNEATDACARLKRVSATLLNQSVLLRGVNDSSDTLTELGESLFEAGVLPYYLHHPDRAAGTGYFDVTKDRGLAIYHELRCRLPGYLVPRYVIDEVGFPYKRNVETTSSL